MTKPTKTAKKPAKFYPEGEKYFFFKKRPINDVIIDDYATAYLKWGLENDDALILSDFPLSIGMYPSNFRKLMDRHEGLRRAHAVVKAAIASRREKGAMKRKFDAGIVKHMMPHYSDDWKVIGEWYANLKSKEEEAKKQNITVILDKMPDTKEVPSKYESKD